EVPAGLCGWWFDSDGWRLKPVRPTAAEQLRIRGGDQAPLTLVQIRIQLSIFPLQRGLRSHMSSIKCFGPNVQLILPRLLREAFENFRGRLELTQREQDDASRRQKDIRSYMDECFHIQRDFLTGSYKRWTKTKPLKDVDIFCVLGEDERPYRDKPPSVLLGRVEGKLVEKYGRDCVKCQRRSVSVEFGVAGEDERILSFDVVPAYD